MERWKDIPGYEGIYQASDTGQIRTKPGKTTYTERHGVRHWKTRVLKAKCQTRKGGTGKRDARVNLWKDGKEKTWLVSRLVALTWCDGYTDRMTVNHIDGNPMNNSADNLEWIPLSENIAKGFDAGLYKTTQVPVRLVSTEETISFPSVAETCKWLNRSKAYFYRYLHRGQCVKDGAGKCYTIVRDAS